MSAGKDVYRGMWRIVNGLASVGGRVTAVFLPDEDFDAICDAYRLGRRSHFEDRGFTVMRDRFAHLEEVRHD